MGERGWETLSRDEQDLLRYYRGLPTGQQFDILGMTEARFNAVRRFEELTRRGESIGKVLETWSH